MLNSKRLRIFAGPNGSGKSTLFASIQERFGTGPFINSDIIEEDIRRKGFINLEDYELTSDQQTWDEFCLLQESTTLITKAVQEGFSIQIKISENVLINQRQNSNSYLAALITSFLRYYLIQNGNSFSYESVMSHPSKIKEIEHAKNMGYATYLYFVCLEDPLLNISRVSNRVEKGGHSVPEDKIIQRYYRTLDLLLPALRGSSKAYIFDNSEKEMKLIAKVKNGELTLLLPTEELPKWFLSAVINKLHA